LTKCPPDNFVTLLLSRPDPRTPSRAHTDAGHPMGYVRDRSGAACVEAGGTGLPLGVSPEATFPPRPALVPWITGGILDARCPGGTRFGVRRAPDLVRIYRQDGAPETADPYRAVRAFSQELPREDGITAVVVKVGRGTAPESVPAPGRLRPRVCPSYTLTGTGEQAGYRADLHTTPCTPGAGRRVFVRVTGHVRVQRARSPDRRLRLPRGG
jgi:hypothetical protein